ncbi:hypothetical protein GCM10009830_25490 [Glycomyces endophyticus]|uniref:SHOCT domain-containing protein n=1 Tax=Glycomyces endophyticus TaxID=480996 RepID=A0ABP4SUG2_9ACTN
MPSTPHPDAKRRNPAAALLRLLLIAALAAAAWWLIATGVRVGHTVVWECWGGECSTNDWRALLPVAGIICNVVLLIMLAALARAFGFGLAALVGLLAALSGWSAAVTEDGLDPAAVATESRIVGALAGVAAVIALLGLLAELKTTGYGARLLGAKRVPAELADYRSADAPIGGFSAETAAASGFGTAELRFTDNGRRHAVRIRVNRKWVGNPVYAVFRETRPERARIALPWIRSFTAPDDADTPSPPTPAPADSFVAELERLAALRAAGHLTQEELEAAKRRLLDQ